MHFMFLHEFVVILNCVVYDAQFFLRNYSQSQQVKSVHVVYLRKGRWWKVQHFSVCEYTTIQMFGVFKIFNVFEKIVSYGRQGCIYLIKHTVQV